MLTSLLAALPLGLPAAAAPPAPAPPAPLAVQQVHKDDRYGFQFRPPRGWRSIPLKSDEAWLAAKYQSDKTYYYTDDAQGYTYDHTPEVLCIAFVAERLRPKKKTEEIEGEDGVKIEITTIDNPYKDYEDFLDRTYQGGGWYVSEKEEGEHKGIPVTRYEIKVEKLARSGPKRILSWVIHTDGIDFALQTEVLEDEYPKLKKTVEATYKSFEEIERTGILPTSGLTHDAIRITRKELDTEDPKERRTVRQRSQKLEQERAIANLADGWSHDMHDKVLVLTHNEDDWADRVGDHAAALLDWFEKELSYFGEGEYARGPVIRVCDDFDERAAFDRGVRTGTDSAYISFGPGAEIVTHKDTAGWIGYEMGMVNQRLLGNWMMERDRDLASALPSWAQTGLREFVDGARLDGRKLDFRVDAMVRDYARLAVSQDRATPPRELMSMTREQYNSAGGESGFTRYTEAAMLVRFLMSKEATRCKQAKGLFEAYVRNLDATVAEVEKKDLEKRKELSDKAPETEEEEEALAKERANRWREREKEIMETTFERTFAGWKDSDWDKFHKAYFAYISS